MGIIDDLIGEGIRWAGDVADEIKDWADEDPGLTLFRAVATSLSGGLAPILGPQLASIAFALPGLARGDRFDEAWWNEFCWRVEKTAEILARDALNSYVAQFKKAGEKLLAEASGSFPNMPIDDAVRHLAPDIRKHRNRQGSASFGRRTGADHDTDRSAVS